ncbi:protein ALP1-like [Homalodisca vitripennis]|uniref:protein ALP1-like n=1 Tax=Homalodisca vitripennis TaxID=197043 RepID=UPI001EEA243D|nr:protein ALP1-like [Homalodisca vitripennis]
MSRECFFVVLDLVKDDITKRSTNSREPVLCNWIFKALSYYFVKGHSTISMVVHQTSKAIWKNLQPVYMPKPTAEKWKQVSDRMLSLWNMPNCIGSIDVSDADGMLLVIDVGDYGRNSDGHVMANSSFCRAFKKGNLDLPEPSPIAGDNQPIPYYFITDEAFPMSKNLLKPYSKKALTTNSRRIFNSRLSRSRKPVECSFGMLSSKFGVLNTLITCTPDNVDIFVQAMCVLHNAIRECDDTFTKPQYENVIDSDSIVLLPRLPLTTGKLMRDYLSTYFTECAPIPHQDRRDAEGTYVHATSPPNVCSV